MKILVVSMKYDYGEPERGPSGNEEYFEQPLRRLGHQARSFDFMAQGRTLGRDGMNDALLSTVRLEKPDLVIFVLHGDEFRPETIRQITQETCTLGYFFDDAWRTEYSALWARRFHYVTTSDVNGEKRWTDAGLSNFIYSPFGCRRDIFRKKGLPKIYDVTFVGQYHPFRAWVFRELRRKGIAVSAWGYGWRSGRIAFDEMVDVFNQSRINLNLSNNESWDLRYVLQLSRPLVETLRAWKKTVRSLTAKDAKIREMVKARHFEINGCGGFQLSYYVEGLERHYLLGEEIALYNSMEDLVEKIRYFLKHEDERETMAERGYTRTMEEHTLESRFENLLERLKAKNAFGPGDRRELAARANGH